MKVKKALLASGLLLSTVFATATAVSADWSERITVYLPAWGHSVYPDVNAYKSTGSSEFSTYGNTPNPSLTPYCRLVADTSPRSAWTPVTYREMNSVWDNTGLPGYFYKSNIGSNRLYPIGMRIVYGFDPY